MVGLENELSKRIGTLSGGQQQRAGIALELLRSPGLLILDEPASGLDPATESDIMRYLRRIADQGKTVLCSTHLMENFEMFDKILLSRGRAVFFGTPNELLCYFSVNRPMEVFRRLGEGPPEQQAETAELMAKQFESSPFFQNTQGSPTQTSPPLREPGQVPLLSQYQNAAWELFPFAFFPLVSSSAVFDYHGD